MKRKLVSILAVLLCLGACTQAEDERGSAFKLQEAAGHGQEASDRAKDEILAMEEVISVRGIQYKEEMVMAMHVKQVDRFQLKDVRKKHLTGSKHYIQIIRSTFPRTRKSTKN